jgi:hypothetical protein
MRDFSRFSENKFINEVRQIRWNIVIEKHRRNVDKLFSSFYNKLNKLVNKHVPRKNVTKRDMKNFSKPWITTGIKRSIKEKNRLLTQGEHEKYKYYRNRISTLIRVSKKKYYYEYFEINLNNMKNTWDGINDLINRKKRKSCKISGLKDTETGQIIRDPSVLPNLLNKYFASIGHKLGTDTTQSESHFSDYMKNIQIQQSFFCTPITPSEIESEILSIPNKKAYGLYSYPTKILKCSSNVISKPFSDILNISIENGVYPSILKHAKVIPIFKSGDETEKGNYRPISLLSNLNRIFEKVMYKRFMSFIQDKNILYHSQYGFRRQHSTQHAILDIVNRIQENIDNKKFTCGIFIDLQKAFDTVDHTILLRKLQCYGFRGIIYDWFSSYLTNRIQTTEIDNNISNKERTICGVPQGSVLGPLLFLIYINDIHYSSDKLSFHLFADDSNLLYSNKNPKTLESIVNT